MVMNSLPNNDDSRTAVTKGSTGIAKNTTINEKKNIRQLNEQTHAKIEEKARGHEVSQTAMAQEQSSQKGQHEW